MARKLAVKRLTQSDLSLFAQHFRASEKAGRLQRQKAINLNVNIFVDDFFPALSQYPRGSQKRFPIDLYIYGPGLAQEVNLQRKIIKSDKNWRLDGELVHDPEDQPDRFAQIGIDDLAVMEFGGVVEPNAIKLFLVSASHGEDRPLHRLLNELVGAGNMVALSSQALGQAAAAVTLAAEHSFNLLLLEDAIEDAALGGAWGLQRLQDAQAARWLSAEDLRRAKEHAAEVGASGEALTNAYFRNLVAAGKIQDWRWISRERAGAPFDFAVTESSGEITRIDVKSTQGEFTRPLHISMNELRAISDGSGPYAIYRVYELSEIGAKLLIADDIADSLAGLTHALSHLPSGAKVDSISLIPDALNFGAETDLLSTEIDEDSN